MKIKYINHSGFIIENGDCAVMVDCCGLTKDSEAVRECTGKYLYILASHVHGDHFDPGIFSLEGDRSKFILSADIREKAPRFIDAFYMIKGDVYTDERIKIKAYGSTDEGVSFYMKPAVIKFSMPAT